MFATKEQEDLSLSIWRELIDQNQLISPNCLALFARWFKYWVENNIPIDDQWVSCVRTGPNPENRDNSGLVLDNESDDEEYDLAYADDEFPNSGEEDEELELEETPSELIPSQAWKAPQYWQRNFLYLDGSSRRLPNVRRGTWISDESMAIFLSAMSQALVKSSSAEIFNDREMSCASVPNGLQTIANTGRDELRSIASIPGNPRD